MYRQNVQPPSGRDGLSDVSAGELPPSTKWYRAHGRATRRDKAAKEQYLTPQEEKSLVAHALRMDRNGFPMPVKALRFLAMVVRQKRDHGNTTRDSVQPPGKNWPQGFYKRNTELKPRRVKAIDWKRHDHNIYDKVADWFDMIGQELANPAVLQENVYNMDETGILLSVLGSLKVLVGRDDLRNYRGAGSQRTLITAIECISADGRCLEPLIIWPAATHRSTWTTYPTPGWHFACSDSGYTNTKISLYWVQHVFDPLTRARANGKPRVLISDGFASHESLEVLTFCFQNNITLCRLPSHTSHKLQPCDVAVFGPLKTAYREQVELLYRRGADVIGKQHFTQLYSGARTAAMTARNIHSGWSKAGLFPHNPERVLRTLKQPPPDARPDFPSRAPPAPVPDAHQTPLTTPTSAHGLGAMRQTLDQIISALDNDAKPHMQKIFNAAERSLAHCTLLQDENQQLMKQNREKRLRKSTKATVVGTAKIMSYEDIERAKKKRAEKEAASAGRGKRKSKGAAKYVTLPQEKRVCEGEIELGRREIARAGLTSHCTILDFS
jgi:hypothetical protein